MVWGCFAALGPGCNHLFMMDPNCIWVLQQNNYPTHAVENPKKKKKKVGAKQKT